MDDEATIIRSHLDTIVIAINNETCAMNEVAVQLREHADRMYGPSPEKGSDTAQAFPDTGLGVLEQALENLREATGRVAYEAGRNTTFA